MSLSRQLLGTLAIICGYWAARTLILHHIPVSPTPELKRSWEAKANVAGAAAGLKWYRANGRDWSILNSRREPPAGWPHPELSGRKLSPVEYFDVFVQLTDLEGKERRGRWRGLISQVMISMPGLLNRSVYLDGPYEAWAEAWNARYREQARPWLSSQWHLWDMAMALPRLLGFILCLFWASRTGGFGVPGWSARPQARSLGGLACVLAGFVLIITAGGDDRKPIGQAAAAIMLANTALVGLFEEAAFRGLLFRQLARACSVVKAAVLSSLIFTLWHLPLYSVYAMPAQFLFGLGTCAALAGGAGLPWLVCVHFLVDASAILGAGAWHAPAPMLIGHSLLAFGALAPLWRLRRAAADPLAAQAQSGLM